MNKMQLKVTLMTLAVASALTGCLGGGGGGSVAGVGGKVVDGYVSDATVTQDVNDDGVCAPGEPTTTTDAQGNFSFPGSAPHMVCAKGGTDLSTGAPFVGELTAPAGATQITPLTSLVVAKIAADKAMTPPVITTPAAAAATIATNLGLSSTTNLLSDDPVALAATNPKLTQTTAAVQTLLIQVANNVASAATGTTATPAQTAALFASAVAGLSEAVAAQAAPVDLTSTSTAGTTAATKLITAAISNTVTTVQSDQTAAATVPGVANLAPASVAAAAATNVTHVAQQVASVPAATLVATATTGVTSAALIAQTDTTASQTTALMGNLLTTTAASLATADSFAAIQAAATTVANDISNGDATAAATAVNTSATAITTESVPLVSAPTLPTLTNVLLLSAPMVNGVAVNTTTSPYSVTVAGPLTYASLNVAAVDAPVFAANAMIGFDVVEEAPGTRSLQLIIDKATITNTAGVVSVTVPANATLYVRGVHTDKTVSVVALTNIASNVLTVTGGVMTVNWNNALSRLSSQAGFANFALSKGTFKVTAAMSGAPLAIQTSIPGSVPVKAGFSTVSIPASTAIPSGASVSGQGTSFMVTVQ